MSVDLRVLHLGKYYPPFKGGLEFYLHDLLLALARLGVETTALVHQHQRSWRTRKEQQKQPGPDTEVMSRVLRANNLGTLAYAPISPGLPLALRRLLRDFRPDLIHAHLPNPAAFWLLALPSARQVPLVLHWHSDVVTDAHGPLSRLLHGPYRQGERALLERAAKVIVTSPPYLASSGPLREFHAKCEVVPLGLDPFRLPAVCTGPAPVRSARPGPRPELEVLAIGRLAYYKGFEYLVRAVADTPGVRVHLVGSGEQERELKALVRDLGLGERVLLYGELSPEALAARFAECDCLCLPSIERTEAFGLVLLEAMCLAKPVLATRVVGSGMGWVVEDEVTGLLVPPADSAALAAGLARLRDEPLLRQRLGQAGKVRFANQFSIESSARDVLAVYNSVLANTAIDSPEPA